MAEALRKQEILGLTWDEIDKAGGVIRLSPARSKGASVIKCW